MHETPRRYLGRALLTAVAALTLWPAVAWGENAPLARAQKAYDDLQFERVESLLQRAAKVAATDAERAQVLRLTGMVAAVLGRERDAVTAFVELLRLEPGFRFPRRESPKIVSLFAEAQRLAPTAAERTPGSGDQVGAAPGATPTPAVTGELPPPLPSAVWPRYAGLGLGVVGLACLGVGTYSGVRARASAAASAGDVAQRTGMARYGEAEHQARLANVLFLVGGVLTVSSGGLLTLGFLDDATEGQP